MPLANVALSDVRDLAVVVAGIMWIILGLIPLAIAYLVFHFGRKGMKALHRLLRTKVRPALDRAQGISERIRDRTAALPGAPGGPGAIEGIVAGVSEVRKVEIKPPFRRKIRSWRPF